MITADLEQENEHQIFKEKTTISKKFLFVLDLFLVLLAFWVGYQIRDSVGLFYGIDTVREIYPLNRYYNLIPWTLGVWGFSLYFIGTYKSFRTASTWDVLLDVSKSGMIATLLFAGVAYLFKLEYVSRALISIVFLTAGIFLTAERVAVVSVLRYFRQRGYDDHYVLIVGTGQRAQDLMNIVHNNPHWGYKISGLVDEESEMLGKEIAGSKVIGTLSDIPHLLMNTIVDEVIFVVPRSWIGKIEEVMLVCEDLGKRVSVVVDYFNPKKFVKVRQRSFSKFHLLTFETTSDDLFQLFIKRLLDIVFSGIALILLSPLFFIVAVLIKAVSPGPVFFTQIRSGLNGRKFKLYKFRTMVADAEARLESLRAFNEMSGPVFKMTKDPRLTPMGGWMRKFSVDELPQFINVFNGDMSIVGPRPPIPSEVENYSQWQRRRLSMRPGLTCLWQAFGRNKIVDFGQWMKMDLEYIDGWSLKLDLLIFLRTVPAVLFGAGAK